MGCGTAGEADGEEVGFIVGVEDGVGSPFFVDDEGAEGRWRHGEFS